MGETKKKLARLFKWESGLGFKDRFFFAAEFELRHMFSGIFRANSIANGSDYAKISFLNLKHIDLIIFLS